MDLRTYLIESELTQEGFARKIKVSFACVAKVCCRRGNPALEVAIRIVKATKGHVTYEDLLVCKMKKSKPRRRKILEQAA